MAIKVNGTTIPTTKGSIKVNGTSIEKVICNGTTVWEIPKNIVENGVITITPSTYGDWTYENGTGLYMTNSVLRVVNDYKTTNPAEFSVDVTGISTITVNLSEYKITWSADAYPNTDVYLTCGSLSARKTHSMSNASGSGTKDDAPTSFSLDVSSLSGIQTVTLYVIINSRRNSSAYYWTNDSWVTVSSITMS